MTRAIGYARVSTKEQEDSGAGLNAQREAIEREIERRGWAWSDNLAAPKTFVDICSGSTPWRNRERLPLAIEVIESGQADVLVVAKMDRLSRSLLDFADILERARKKGWAIVLLDFGLDLTTPVGEMVASILAAVAQFERRRIGERTREALAAKKAQGVKLGRPSTVEPHIVTRILEMRARGCSYQFIADTLNVDGIPTAQGGTRWRDTSVRAVYKANAYTMDGITARFDTSAWHGQIQASGGSTESQG